ncbi:MAG: hypothetical protein K2X98_02585 [Alphaproteobacteria bacterium]|nr:hypothetical protein [Alphaproteobacteria bacterium]
MIRRISITIFLLLVSSVTVRAMEAAADGNTQEQSRRYLAEQRKKLEELKKNQPIHGAAHKEKTFVRQSDIYEPFPVSPLYPMEFFALLGQEESLSSIEENKNEEVFSLIRNKAKNIFSIIMNERAWGTASKESAHLVVLIDSPQIPSTVKQDENIKQLRERLLTFNTLTENLTRAKTARIHSRERMPVGKPAKKQEEELRAENAFKRWFESYEIFLKTL